MEVGLGPCDIVSHGDQAPPHGQGHSTPRHFSAHVYCGQMTRWIHLSTEVGLGPGDILLDRDPFPPRKGHISPHFSAHVYCGQTAGWLRIPLGTEVVLGQGDIALDRDLSPHGKGNNSPHVWLTLLWHGRPSPQLLSSCLVVRQSRFNAHCKVGLIRLNRSICSLSPVNLGIKQ